MRPSQGPLRLNGGANGGVSVTGWDRDSIHIIAHVEAHGETLAAARAAAREIRVIADGSEVYAEGPGGRFRNGPGWSVSFEIFAPRNSDMTATTMNGSVHVEDMVGTLRLESENGPITLLGVGGDVQARATNGPLHIELSGSKWEGTGLDAETVNGPVHLEIPTQYSARLETGSVNGPFDLDSPLTVTFQGRRYSRITSILGTGGAPVRAVTTNGPVQIRRD